MRKISPTLTSSWDASSTVVIPFQILTLRAGEILAGSHKKAGGKPKPPPARVTVQEEI